MRANQRKNKKKYYSYLKEKEKKKKKREKHYSLPNGGSICRYDFEVQVDLNENNLAKIKYSRLYFGESNLEN